MNNISAARLSIYFAELVQSYYKNKSQMEKLAAQSMYFKFSNATKPTRELLSAALECWHVTDSNLHAENVKLFSIEDVEFWELHYLVMVDGIAIFFNCSVNDDGAFDFELEVHEDGFEIKDSYNYYIARTSCAVT